MSNSPRPTFLDQWLSMTRGTRFQVMFYGIIAFLGVVFLLLPKIATSAQWEAPFVGIGIAFVASSIIGFAQRLFFFDDFKNEMRGLVDHSLRTFLVDNLLPFFDEGVERLWMDRGSAMREFFHRLEAEKKEIVIIGSSLKGMLAPKEQDELKNKIADLLREKHKEGVKVQFLLTHPAVAFLREDAEGRQFGDIKDEIQQTIAYLTEDPGGEGEDGGLGIPLSNIRLYNGTPSIFCLITSSRMLINPYAYQANAFENFCISIEKKSEDCLYTKIRNAHFVKAWNNPRTCTIIVEKRADDVKNATSVDAVENATLYTLFPKRRSALLSDEELEKCYQEMRQGEERQREERQGESKPVVPVSFGPKGEQVKRENDDVAAGLRDVPDSSKDQPTAP